MGRRVGLARSGSADRVIAVVSAERVRVLDLFAGAGGLTEGFRQVSARYTVVGAVESDVAAAATYAANHGADPLFAGTIEKWLENGGPSRSEVVVGGPPCQGFSSLGRRDAEDERNLLWQKYVETVRRACPMFFVLENVPAFLRSAQFAQLEAATKRGGRLRDHSIKAYTLNSADYGSAQSRKRAVVIGHHRDLKAPGPPIATHIGAWRTVRCALVDVPSAAPSSTLPELTIEFAGKSIPGAFKSDELHVSRFYSALSMERIRSIPSGGNRFDIPHRLLPNCWKNHSTGSHDVMGRLRWDRPSVTIRTEFFKPEKGRYLHPDFDRAITHLEAALLQGFPLEYQWCGSRFAIARQIGNAVPVELGKALGLHILGKIDGKG